mmetsp:Transcript_68592/g.193513  ORF Transcript_68592/g.193513 Transcript_68592/m.193513 type:complete len:255 (+) Transcript_68592:142-906(+)
MAGMLRLQPLRLRLAVLMDLSLSSCCIMRFNLTSSNSARFVSFSLRRVAMSWAFPRRADSEALFAAKTTAMTWKISRMRSDAASLAGLSSASPSRCAASDMSVEGNLKLSSATTGKHFTPLLETKSSADSTSRCSRMYGVHTTITFDRLDSKSMLPFHTLGMSSRKWVKCERSMCCRTSAVETASRFIRSQMIGCEVASPADDALLTSCQSGVIKRAKEGWETTMIFAISFMVLSVTLCGTSMHAWRRSQRMVS